MVLTLRLRAADVCQFTDSGCADCHVVVSYPPVLDEASTIDLVVEGYRGLARTVMGTLTFSVVRKIGTINHAPN